MIYKLRSNFKRLTKTLIKNKVEFINNHTILYDKDMYWSISNTNYVKAHYTTHTKDMGYCYVPNFILEIEDESEILDKEQFDLMFEPFVENEENQLQNTEV